MARLLRGRHYPSVAAPLSIAGRKHGAWRPGGEISASEQRNGSAAWRATFL